ncbi:hypothetical protein BK133_05020 [Paenibacillus sp. FSL H8-0548]|uniref:STAS-like domain-containing protein n=1 Tax=Paenibacillus sp. FSL H8-0548 TaxID=1920422 RepID=UPI00096E9746|nr:STAS-like domain-containing protein [Paenibacillus sp. FSL H8-0548]OMF37419.1 hypothetical protein BK133_05020 [Paenibacillus sp. FSL H8-0548]
MVVVVQDIVQGCHTNQDGDVVYNEIYQTIIDGQTVTVSFKGVSSVTSSFLNSAFIPLLDRSDLDHVKRNLKFVDSNKSINEMIIRRFKQEEDTIRA